MSTNILIVSASMGQDSQGRHLAELALKAAQSAGAEARHLKLTDAALPVMVPGDKDQKSLPAVVEVRELASWADGFILVTPEYHGNISGALKNWFDFLYPELAGKLAGVLATTGGGGGDMSIVSTKNSFNWCHGFTLPFHAAASGKDFDGDTLTNDRVRDRIERVAHDVARYAPLLREAFEAARGLGKGAEAGFAGLHA